ncbi:MAG: hypothetical protein E6Q97_31650 [Desulfurellales bacterium]|nr:MAG: hypothetical protein E6Q97_31650 [Desulfurellales bacterium]
MAPTAGSELAGWINGWIEASPLENEEARRALATGMAVCRRFTDETARIKAPLHLALTDGQARMLTQALKMLPIYAEKLGVTVVDKVRKKQRRQKAEPAKWQAPPAGKVTDVDSETLALDIHGKEEDPPHSGRVKAPWEE